MSERKVYDCDKCGQELDEPKPMYATHSGHSYRIDLCHGCAVQAAATLLHAFEHGEKLNGTWFINEFGGLTQLEDRKPEPKWAGGGCRPD